MVSKTNCWINSIPIESFSMPLDALSTTTGDGIVGDQGASTGVDPPGSDPESTRPGTSGEGDTTPGEDGTSSEQGDTSPGKGSTNQSPQPCKARGGSFGSFEGDTNVLEFLYELETTTSVTITERVIMPILEQTMVDSVLSEVFSEQCPSTRKRNLRFENNNRKLDVVGISRYPPDIALPGGEFFVAYCLVMLTYSLRKFDLTDS